MLRNDITNDTQPQKKNLPLQFDPNRHCIVNLISTLTNRQLVDLINYTNSEYTVTPSGKNTELIQIVKAVPLPGVQFLSGN